MMRNLSLALKEDVMMNCTDHPAVVDCIITTEGWVYRHVFEALESAIRAMKFAVVVMKKHVRGECFLPMTLRTALWSANSSIDTYEGLARRAREVRAVLREEEGEQGDEGKDGQARLYCRQGGEGVNPDFCAV